MSIYIEITDDELPEVPERINSPSILERTTVMWFCAFEITHNFLLHSHDEGFGKRKQHWRVWQVCLHMLVPTPSLESRENKTRQRQFRLQIGDNQ
jgi:hypothetical protein